MEYGAGAGLYWVLALLIVAGLAIAAGLIGGRFRFRWSWTDAAVVTLMVAGRTQRAACDGPAPRDQPGLGMDGDGGRLSAVAQPAPDPGRVVGAGRRDGRHRLRRLGLWPLSGRGRDPADPRGLSAEPGPVLAPTSRDGRRPGHARSRPSSSNRLLQSSEITSTFALANSLAGFIVGPLVMVAGRLVVQPGRVANRPVRDGRPS